MPEQEKSDKKEQLNNKEQPSIYCQAARFRMEAPARRAYDQAQELIFSSREHCDLSAYRFLLERVSHVVVLGEAPPEEIAQRLQTILATGEPTTLPEEIVRLLCARRAQASTLGPWVEGHYRPGRRL